jgi:hypothetical protein
MVMVQLHVHGSELGVLAVVEILLKHGITMDLIGPREEQVLQDAASRDHESLSRGLQSVLIPPPQLPRTPFVTGLHLQ